MDTLDRALDLLVQERWDPVLTGVFLEYGPAAVRGHHQDSHAFPVVVWKEPGLGYMFRITKSGYVSPPHTRVYEYGPFSASQAREFLDRLSARHEWQGTGAGLQSVISGFTEPVGLLVDVDPSTLATIWRSPRFSYSKHYRW